jgi:hypothetical protein
VYGLSLTVRPPDSVSCEGSTATGAVLREPIMCEYAERAAFKMVTTLELGREVGRFYRLQP